MSDTKAVTVATPNDLLKIAVDQNADMDKLEKLLDLQMRWEANEAHKAYVVAMAAFKADPPHINKDKTVAYKGTRYTHASLANVTEQINAALSKHGLSSAWRTAQSDGAVTVECTITHNMGHSESTSLSAPHDTSGSKNAIQAIGSTVSYLQRYTLLALTGLATFDMDDDATTADSNQTSAVAQWLALCDTYAERADADMAKWWASNADQIKAECGKADAAKVYQMMLAHKKRLTREPGSDDE